VLSSHLRQVGQAPRQRRPETLSPKGAALEFYRVWQTLRSVQERLRFLTDELGCPAERAGRFVCSSTKKGSDSAWASISAPASASRASWSTPTTIGPCVCVVPENDVDSSKNFFRRIIDHRPFSTHLPSAVLETFLNSQGGIGSRSAHNPRLASRASDSSLASVLSSGAYRRNHHAKPAPTIS
jgi:hypothetical protein